ncbi:bifunctional 4-hydroxy-2-oxoglutarate aldolase/2-dehydro-3-deoxy-phosphogluconate aldolase [Paradesulfitobacterium aromaticivorans]
MAELTKEEVRNLILSERIIAILRHVKEADVKSILEALYQGGIRVAEVTLNTQGALKILRQMADVIGTKMLLGAGTVTTEDMVEEAVNAGARFIVTPIMVPEVIKKCLALGVAVVPGAMSPTEIAVAYRLGADLVKVFPANSLGAGYFKELQGPLGHIPMIATGGISLANGRSFLQAGAKGLGIGSSLISPQLVSEGRWEDLRRLAQDYKEMVNF